MKAYNGFSAAQRQRVSDKQKEAIAQGLIPKPTACQLCGLKDGLIMLHNEDYSIWDEYAEMCVECHMKLHARFSKPNSWLNHITRLREGYVSKPYKNVYLYILSTGESPDEALVATERYNDTWWERLSMSWGKWDFNNKVR